MIAANRYTTTELIASVQRKAHIPQSQRTFDDEGILALAQDELDTGLLSQILSARENYYLKYVDLDIAADNRYAIPGRAIGGMLSVIKLVDGNTFYDVDRTEINEQFSSVTSPTGAYAFTIEDNEVVILPNPQVGVVRLWHYRTPNSLVVTSAAAQITAIDGNVLTFDSLPATFTAESLFDIIQDQPPFNWRSIDLTPVNLTSTTIEFDSVPSTLSVGDWVALAGQTPVPQIPKEFRPLLVQRTVVKYYEAQGYLDKMKVAQAKLDEMEKEIMGLINPRVVESPKKIIANSSIIGGYRRWRAWRAT